MKKIISLALVLTFALTLSLTACSKQSGPAAGGGGTTYLNLASGGTSGTYYPYGAALATVIGESVAGTSVNVQSTGASSENIHLIDERKADIAIVQNDVMTYAYEGTELFAGKQVKGFSTMATVYAEVCQIIATADSGINSIADLKGKRVSVGAPGSGVEANSKQILESYGITFNDIKVENLGFGDSADAIKDNKIDAFFCTAGIPTTAVMELATTKNIKVLAIDDAKAKELTDKYAYYTVVTIPKDAYKGMTEDVQTLAVKATLIVNPDLSEELVYNMTKAIFEGKEKIAAAHAKGKELDVSTAVQGVSVPFHPGAEKYFKEVGAIK